MPTDIVTHDKLFSDCFSRILGRPDGKWWTWRPPRAVKQKGLFFVRDFCFVRRSYWLPNAVPKLVERPRLHPTWRRDGTWTSAGFSIFEDRQIVAKAAELKALLRV